MSVAEISHALPTQDTSATSKRVVPGGLDIVIVSYNTRDLLLQAIEAAYRADWAGELTVWVVDNDSKDDSVAAARQRFPQAKVIATGQNLGFSKANNVALRQVTGQYVLLLNPDTIVAQDSFTKMAEYLERHSDVGMMTCKLITGDGSLDLACRRSFPTIWDGLCRASGLSFAFPKSRLFARYNVTYLDIDQTYEVDCINGAFMFCKRDAFDQVGLLDEDFFIYSEDVDWCYRFRQAGWKIVYHPASTTIHLKGQSSGVRSERMIHELFKSHRQFLRKALFPAQKLGLAASGHVLVVDVDEVHAASQLAAQAQARASLSEFPAAVPVFKRYRSSFAR